VSSQYLDDDAYPKAISGAKVALALLSIGNKDLHTTRSLEIPSIGTVLCAPRTSDHEALYSDGQEACFFRDANECADICLSLIADNARRELIAAAGHARVLRNRNFNEPIATEILSALSS
jgi:spore maturation protein CgeB